MKNFLENHKVLSIAYGDNIGIGSCALWYASNDELELYFLSSTNTRHSQAILDDPRVSFTIQKDEQDWFKIKGIQGAGTCDIVPKTSEEYAWKVYTSKYPFLQTADHILEAEIKKSNLWKIKPSWIRLINNEIEFGYKQEFKF